MSDTPSIEKIKAFLSAQYEGDFDAAFKNADADKFAWTVDSGGNEDLRAAVPWAGYAHEGKQGYLDLTGALFGEFDIIAFEPRHYVDAGDRVIVEGHFSFRHKTTGKIADSDWMARFEVKEGRIAGGQFFENTHAVAAARRSWPVNPRRRHGS